MFSISRWSFFLRIALVLLVGGFGSVSQALNWDAPVVFPVFAGKIATSDSVDGQGPDARLVGPLGLAADAAGNLFFADQTGHTIRKISPQGVVTTLAGARGYSGSADGQGTAARFNFPAGIAVDGAGTVYVADTGNHTLRKITPNGTVTTLAGSPGLSGKVNGNGSQARFFSPFGIALDSSANLIVADASNHVVRKVTAAGEVSTLAGAFGE